MMNNQEKLELLEPFSSTLMETSYDEVNNVYLVSSNIRAYNYDKFVQGYLQELSPGRASVKSVDALLFRRDGAPVLVEFKNRSKAQLKKLRRDLKEKGYDSLLAYCIMFDASVSFMQKTASYYVIYRDDDDDQTDAKAPSLSYIKDWMWTKACDLPVSFGLSKLEGFCFYRVATLPVGIFESMLFQNEELL